MFALGPEPDHQNPRKTFETIELAKHTIINFLVTSLIVIVKRSRSMRKVSTTTYTV